MVAGCDTLHSGVGLAALRRLDAEGAARACAPRQIQDPLLHVDGLRASAQEVFGAQPNETGLTRGINFRP